MLLGPFFVAPIQRWICAGLRLILEYVNVCGYYTYMAKLTLSVDERIIERAKRYASRRRTSVSRLVQDYLDLLARTRPVKDEELPPVTRRLRGVLKGAKYNREEFIDHLEKKYR